MNSACGANKGVTPLSSHDGGTFTRQPTVLSQIASFVKSVPPLCDQGPPGVTSAAGSASHPGAL